MDEATRKRYEEWKRDDTHYNYNHFKMWSITGEYRRVRVRLSVRNSHLVRAWHKYFLWDEVEDYDCDDKSKVKWWWPDIFFNVFYCQYNELPISWNDDNEDFLADEKNGEEYSVLGDSVDVCQFKRGNHIPYLDELNALQEEIEWLIRELHISYRRRYEASEKERRGFGQHKMPAFSEDEKKLESAYIEKQRKVMAATIEEESEKIVNLCNWIISRMKRVDQLRATILRMN